MSFLDMNKLRKTRSPVPNPVTPQNPWSHSSQTQEPSKTTHPTASQAMDLRTRIHSSASLPPTSSVQTLLKPRSPTEQYWAARALTAETLLSARTKHHQELRSLAYSEELKRSRDLAALAKESDEKQAKLEKVVLSLIGVLLGCLLLVIYLLAHSSRNIIGTSRSGWLASHFTIPILSPFTSVVERETSVVGTRTIVLSIVILCALTYAVFRHWYAASGRRSDG